MRFAALLLVCLLSLLSCGDKPSIEQQVIATLRTMEEAAENGRHLEFMGYVADRFSGQQDTMDRRDFHRFMIYQMNQNRRLQAQFFPITVKETGVDEASAQFRLLVTGGDGLLPERGQIYEVQTTWVFNSGEWMLDTADWRAVRVPVPEPGG